MPKFNKIPFFLQPHASSGIKSLKKWVVTKKNIVALFSLFIPKWRTNSESPIGLHCTLVITNISDLNPIKCMFNKFTLNFNKQLLWFSPLFYCQIMYIDFHCSTKLAKIMCLPFCYKNNVVESNEKPGAFTAYHFIVNHISATVVKRS